MGGLLFVKGLFIILVRARIEWRDRLRLKINRGGVRVYRLEIT